MPKRVTTGCSAPRHCTTPHQVTAKGFLLLFFKKEVLAFFLSFLPIPVLAHHSFAMFDQTKITTVIGTVKEFHWTNPHVSLWVYAAPINGAVPQLWTIELTSPGNLTRAGWTRHSVAPGDKVAVEIAPLRDGTRGGGFKKLTLTDTHQVLTSDFLEKPGLQ
jgi:hypothetical protein